MPSLTREETLKKAKDYIRAEVHLFSGCRDDETAADISNAALFGLPDPHGCAGGVFTSAFLKTLYAYNIDTGKGLTYAGVLKSMRSVLDQGNYSQVPQLSTSRPLDINHKFEIIPSSCSSGTRRAVLIGINYAGMRGELSGCQNDVKNVSY